MRGYVLDANQSTDWSSGTSVEKPPILGFLVLSPEPFCPGPGDIAACFRSGDQDEFHSATAKWTVVRAKMNWDYRQCFGTIAHSRLGPKPVKVAFNEDLFECGPVFYEHVPHMVVEPGSIPGWSVNVFKVGDDRVVEVRRQGRLAVVCHYYNGRLLSLDERDPGESRDWVEEWKRMLHRERDQVTVNTYGGGACLRMACIGRNDPAVYFGDEWGFPVLAEPLNPATFKVGIDVNDASALATIDLIKT